MVKKNSRRQRIGRRGLKNRNRFQRKGSPGQPPLSERILSFLATRDNPTSTTVIMQELSLPGSARKATKEILTSLVKTGKISQKNKKFLAQGDHGLTRATLALTSRGFGFAALEGQKKDEKDIFISQQNLANASHGDSVLINILGSTSRGRRDVRTPPKRIVSSKPIIHIGGIAAMFLPAILIGQSIDIQI